MSSPAGSIVVLLSVMLLLAGVLRWAFGGSERTARSRASDWDDYGLLVPIATASSLPIAEDLCARLRANGVRSTTLTRPNATTVTVMVFEGDAKAAHETLSTLD